MEQSKNYHLVSFYSEVNGIREAPKQTSSKVLMDYGKHQRISPNLIGACIEGVQEFVA